MNLRNQKNNQRGLVRQVILIIVLLVILAYFGFDLKSFFQRQEVKDFIWGVLTIIPFVWNEYIVPVLHFLWYDITIGIIWNFMVYIYEALEGFIQNNA